MVKGQKYHILYKTTCTVTGNFYIGVHSTTDLEDGYLGSGLRLSKSVKKHGKEKHYREILEFFETRESLMNREREIVNEELLKEEKCLNLKPGGEGGFCNEEHRLKAQKSGASSAGRKAIRIHRDRILNDSEYRKKHKDIIIKKCLKNLDWTGRTHKEETKAKIGKTNSIKQLGEKNSQFGTIWINNGFQNKKIKKTEILQEGWKKGRI